MQANWRGRRRSEFDDEGVPALRKLVQAVLQIGSAKPFRDCVDECCDLPLYSLKFPLLRRAPCSLFSSLPVCFLVEGDNELLDQFRREQALLQSLENELFESFCGCWTS